MPGPKPPGPAGIVVVVVVTIGAFERALAIAAACSSAAALRASSRCARRSAAVRGFSAGAVVAVLVPNDGGAIWTSAKSAIGSAVRSKTMMIAKLIRGFPFWEFGLLDFVIAGLL